MTSNQLNYWKLQEEERANRARESENVRHNTAQEQENIRHNVTQEDLTRISQALEKQGLEIEDKKVLNNLANMYLNYGAMEFAQLPDSVQQKIGDLVGVDVTGKDASFSDYFTGFWRELKDIFKGGGAKIVSSLF